MAPIFHQYEYKPGTCEIGENIFTERVHNCGIVIRFLLPNFLSFIALFCLLLGVDPWKEGHSEKCPSNLDLHVYFVLLSFNTLYYFALH